MTWRKAEWAPDEYPDLAPPVRDIQEYLLDLISDLTEDDQYVYMPARPVVTPFFNFAKRSGWEVSDDPLPLVRIPKTHAALKDRAFDEYRRLYSELMKKRDEHNIDSIYYNDWHYHLTTKALKNILKSQNIKKALTDVNNFMTDYFTQLDAHKFDSLNQIRDYPAKLNAAQDIVDAIMHMTDNELREVFGTSDYNKIIPYDEWYGTRDVPDRNNDGNIDGDADDNEDNDFSALIDIVKSVADLEARFPGYLDRLPKDAIGDYKDPSDFKHVPIVEDVLQKLRKLFEDGTFEDAPGNWRVLKNRQDYLDTGKSLALCYGDIERYGPEHHKKYMRLARNNKSILLTNGTSTAEIELVVDKDGTIKEANVGQIQGYHNTNQGIQPGAANQLRSIARQLVGRKFEVSDKRLKMIKYFEEHDWDQQPRIINAINRRF